jgi:putative nucleotidyltransferase with HDIG domain
MEHHHLESYAAGAQGIPRAVLVAFAGGMLGAVAVSQTVATRAPVSEPWWSAVLLLSIACVAASVFQLTRSPFVVASRHRSNDHRVCASEAQSVLRSLTQAAELRDPGAAEHCQRVAFNAERMGEYLGLTEDDLLVLRWAAITHDIGKAGVPNSVLTKPGRLTGDEFEQVKAHCQVGADLIRSASADLAVVADLVLAHHEWWDGRGYPRGLGAAGIPLGARIIAVADVFEALTSERPYRARVSEGEAVAIISAGAGTHFDPDVVAVFQHLYDTGRLNATGHFVQRKVHETLRYHGSMSERASQLPTAGDR